VYQVGDDKLYINNTEYGRYTDMFDTVMTQDKSKINLILMTSDTRKLRDSLQNAQISQFLKKKKVLKWLSSSLLQYSTCEITLCIALCSISHGIVAISSQMVSLRHTLTFTETVNQFRLGQEIKSYHYFNFCTPTKYVGAEAAKTNLKIGHLLQKRKKWLNLKSSFV
jgi:hypothetical protein